MVWLMSGTELQSDIVGLIDGAARRGDVYISAVTAWEVALLEAKNKLVLTARPQDWFEQVCRLPGVSDLQITAKIFTESVGLPGELHKDPADRLLIATARLHNMVLVTRDTKILAYADKGYVRAIAC